MDREQQQELTASLRQMGLAAFNEEPAFVRLTGGVSSDIWRVTLQTRTVCLKRALPKLRVRAEWAVPVKRGENEVAWLQTVAAIAPSAVPLVLGVDPVRQMFALEYLDPTQYVLWKSELLAGRVNPAFARDVGQVLARIHVATAHRPDVVSNFSNDEVFRAIRLEPYLEATALEHPDLRDRLKELVRTTASAKKALVHGDVSPKNILIGPQGPVFLDAECAWYGDPAFDVAFCLNHLLLKCLARPQSAPAFLECFSILADAYFGDVTWESSADMEARVAALVPGLFLARVDGKSPVEYLTAKADKDRVRKVARRLLASPPPHLAAIRDAWQQELGLVPSH